MCSLGFRNTRLLDVKFRKRQFSFAYSVRIPKLEILTENYEHAFVVWENVCTPY